MSYSVVFAVLCALASAARSMPAAAATPIASEAMQEVIITADPLSEVESHIAMPVTVLDSKALRLQSMRSIGDAVGSQLGVTSGDFGASVGRPIIRGLGGARVRVLEDGIGTMDVSTISADHGTAVEPIFAKQIEIFRGPATLLYGSGASGGLVNISNGRIPSAMPGAPVEGEIYNHYDTASDGWLGAFKLDGAVGSNVALHVDGLERSADDIDVPGYARVTPMAGDPRGIAPNSAVKTDNLAAGGSIIGSRGFLGFNVSTYANNYGVPGEQEIDADGNIDGVTIDQEQTRYDVDGALDIDAAFIDSVKTRWGFNDYEHDEVEPGGALGTRFTNDETEGRFEVLHQPLGAWSGVVGLQYVSRDFAAVGEEAFVPASEQDTIAVFLFEKADCGRVHLDAGLRYENQDANDIAHGVNAEHNLLSVSGGGTFEYHEGHFVGFSGTRSQRGPTIEELFAGGPHLATNAFEIGDAALGEETSMNADLYWRKTSGRYRYDFTVFYNDIGDFIYLRSNDGNGDGIADRVEADFLDTGVLAAAPDALLLLNQAQDDAVFWGFELAGEATVFDDARGRLDARVWTDFVDGQIDGGDEVPRLPPLRFGTEFTWERGPLYAGFSVMRVMSEDNPAPLDTKTDGYTMINVDTGYTVNIAGLTDVTVFARGSNLADQTARRHTSFVKDLAPLPGVSGLVGVRASF